MLKIGSASRMLTDVRRSEYLQQIRIRLNTMRSVASILSLIFCVSSHVVSADESLGAEYLTDGKYQLAIQEYTKSIAEKPDWAEPYVNRGAAYVSVGELNKALKDESFAIKLLANGRDNELRSTAYSNRAVIEEKMNRKVDALKDAEAALRLDHKNAKAQEYVLKLRLIKGNGKIDQKHVPLE
jgi:tetratricopeptide (TPR) repeat protein